MNLQQAAEKMDILGKEGKSFLFLTDFLGEQPEVYETKDTLSEKSVLFDLNGKSNFDTEDKIISKKPVMQLSPVSLATYAKAFNIVKEHLHLGNSFLVNLTFPTPIQLNLTLKEVLKASNAKYRFYYPDKFVCFSPETFVRIENGKIYSNPMKGTIDANIPDAKAKILSDQKELAEHTTIVDLIRNDLSMVASKVRVESFRYVEKIKTNRNSILQVSSRISGQLPKDYPKHIGSIIAKLLPAGSISGAPKLKTVEIIKQAEIYERGFYTGICGYFDGKNFDSGVMIRFIEKTANGLIFKSGGGITAFSELEKEYEEMIAKVYLPFA